MILVAGLSKSGKTSTCQEAVRLLPDIRHLKASSILKALGRPLADLSAEEVEANQAALVQGLEAARDGLTIDLLDGHALIEVGSIAFRVSSEVFDALRLSGIAMVHEDAEVISRRRQDTRFVTSVALIERLQALEMEWCVAEASRLRIPFVSLESDRARNLCLFWTDLSGRREATR